MAMMPCHIAPLFFPARRQLVRRPASLSPLPTLALRAQHDSRASVDEELPPERFDVSSNCVQPVFRSAPVDRQKFSSEKKAKILFLSEGNVCRSVYAEAIFTSLIKEEGLQDVLECSSKATRDYNVGEPPDSRTIEVAEDLGLQIRNHTATIFECRRDVIEYDLMLVMDKFTASDAMKEITIYEAVDKQNQYSWKVRRLGEFCIERKIEDIDDPLYGNMGGFEELERLHQAALDIKDSCKGLMKFLLEIKSNLQDSENLKQGIVRSVGYMGPTTWLIPPMLQRSA